MLVVDEGSSALNLVSNVDHLAVALRQDSDEGGWGKKRGAKNKWRRMRDESRACCPLACIKIKKAKKRKGAASNVPMVSSREDAARQMRSSRHPYLHHWLRASSEHQWPRTVACLRKIGSLSSRLDACALISSHGAAMRAACRTQRERDEKTLLRDASAAPRGDF